MIEQRDLRELEGRIDRLETDNADTVSLSFSADVLDELRRYEDGESMDPELAAAIREADLKCL